MLELANAFFGIPLLTEIKTNCIITTKTKYIKL